MFEKLSSFFNKMTKPEVKELGSKDAAKERLHLVLMQDRANVSVDFLELMKQEIIDVIKKYIVVDENAIDVRLTNQENADGTMGEPSLYANIPIINIKNDVKAEKIKDGTLVYENGELEKAAAKEEKKEEVVSEVIELGAPKETTLEAVETSEVQVEVIETETIEEVKQENNIIEDNQVEDVQDLIIEAGEESSDDSENVEPILDFADDEEDDDDDITFDDLLKKAEEEEAIQKEELNNIDSDSEKEKNSKSSKNKKSNKQKKR